MIDKELMDNLNDKDRAVVMQSLESLIEQTYSVENEYKSLKSSYESLEGLIKQIIEVLPNALWVLTPQGEVFLQNSEATELKAHLDAFINSSDGDELYVNERYYLINKKSHSEKMIISATDITSHKRKDRLAFMGQMAAHLAHEIRNPIGSISLLLPTLFKQAPKTSTPLLEEMKKSLMRVERIVKSTLLYSKGVHAKKSTFATDKLQNELQTAVYYYSYEKQIEFAYEFDQDSLHADFNLLSLMLQNFIFNAIDAIEEDDDREEGQIRICLDDNCFRVYDSGVAIENPEKLFVAFNTTKTKGNGLGLVLSQQIAAAHGGGIDFVAEPKHFIITLQGED